MNCPTQFTLALPFPLSPSPSRSPHQELQPGLDFASFVHDEPTRWSVAPYGVAGGQSARLPAPQRRTPVQPIESSLYVLEQGEDQEDSSAAESPR